MSTYRDEDLLKRARSALLSFADQQLPIPAEVAETLWEALIPDLAGSLGKHYLTADLGTVLPSGTPRTGDLHAAAGDPILVLFSRIVRAFVNTLTDVLSAHVSSDDPTAIESCVLEHARQAGLTGRLAERLVDLFREFIRVSDSWPATNGSSTAGADTWVVHGPRGLVDNWNDGTIRKKKDNATHAIILDLRSQPVAFIANDEKPVRLSGRQADLLVQLLKRDGALCSHDLLCKVMWPAKWSRLKRVELTDNLHNLVDQLRSRHQSLDGAIENEYGKGYRIQPPFSQDFRIVEDYR